MFDGGCRRVTRGQQPAGHLVKFYLAQPLVCKASYAYALFIVRLMALIHYSYRLSLWSAVTKNFFKFFMPVVLCIAQMTHSQVSEVLLIFGPLVNAGA